MKKMFVKIVCNVVVVFLLINLSGCTSNNNVTSNVNSTVDTNLNATGYPVAKEKITLNFMAPKKAIHGPYEEMSLFKLMEEKTNIHINWDTPSDSQYYEKMNLRIASNDLPDAFFLWIPRDVETKRGPDGTLISLENLIDKYAPNYKKIMDKFPSIKPSTTYLDGHMYTTAVAQDLKSDLTYKEWINKKWLDKLGLAIPKTIDEFYGVLKAFKEKDPNGNGKADEVPLSFEMSSALKSFLLSPYGMISNGSEIVNGKATFVPVTNEYKQFLTMTNKMYTEKLLDNDLYILTFERFIAKGKQNILGCFDASSPEYVVGSENAKDYIALSPLTSTTNSKKTWWKFWDIYPGGFAITKANTHPEATTRWYDVLFSEEGAQWQLAGREGTDWKWTDDSKTQWIPLAPKGVDFDAYRGSSISPMAGIGPIAYKDGSFAQKIKDDNAKYSRDQFDLAGYDKCYRETFPWIYNTVDENDMIMNLSTDINKYVGEMEANFITGKSPISNWDSYINVLNSMNYKELVKIQQTAFDRLNKQ
jgi:putative aldouronate transport system substrate-binding protein